jgi:hypothetical protein
LIPPELMNTDAVLATADLVERTGSTGLEIGYIHDDVPVDQAGWYAHAAYLGARLTAENHASPSAAALGLAERILAGATCRCRQVVTLADDRPGCRWQLMGKRWISGCDAPSLKIDGPRGDITAMRRALEADA